MTDDIDTQRVGTVIDVAIAEWERSRLPAAAVAAARKRANSVNELVIWIRGEVRWLATAGDYDTGTMVRFSGSHLDRRSQVHQQAHRTDCALRVIHQPDQLPQRRLSAKIDNAAKRWMHV